MLSAAEYRQRAIECVEMADRSEPDRRQELLELAEVWFKLAIDATEKDRRAAAFPITLH